MSKPSQSDSRKQQEFDREKKNQNIPRHVSVTPTGEQPLGRPKSKVLEDCQKLVNEILDKYPEGYNIGYFRKMFLDRYGYSFDLRALGYDRLASLLLTLPGVKVESSYIFPSGYSSDDYSLDIAVPNILEENASNRVDDSDSDLSCVSKKDVMVSTRWEELGPVANISEPKLKSVLKTGVEAPIGRQKDTDYEPSPSDDSDLDEDICTESGTVGQAKRPSGVEDSSFLRVLDSWCAEQEGEKSKGEPETVDGMVDCSRNGSKPSDDDSFEVDSKQETSSGNYQSKHKLRKAYSFVADTGGVENDKLIDGILGSLKKSSQSRMKS